jgi:ribose transport system ATP-binding protein
MTEPLLSARGLVRRYPGVLALDGADFEIRSGEIIGLVGKNGAGKSTLIRIMAGVEFPDEGELLIAGQPVPAGYDPPTAHRLGLAFMHQELGNVATMTVMENVTLGTRFPRRFGVFIAWDKLSARVADVLADTDATIDPATRVGDLTNVQQRMVMIARALYHSARILVLDEPSTAMTAAETAHLHSIVRRLRDDGHAIVYVSHRLREIVDITDRVVVMQDGRVTLNRPTAQTSEASIFSAITGEEGVPRAELANRPPRATAGAETLLRVRDLGRAGAIADVSFDLHAGEILGIGGLLGSGRTELVRLIFGADRATSGRIEIDGSPLRINSPRDAIGAGIGLLPEDRRNQGLILSFSVGENVTLASLKRHRASLLPFISRRSERRAVDSYIESLSIRTPGPDQVVRRLSGGNQQKVVLAKWLMRSNRVLIFDEPTQGIDIHAKQEMFALMRAFAAQGGAAIVISSDFSELVLLCDRVLVLREGATMGVLEGEEISEAAIVRLAYGATAA